VQTNIDIYLIGFSVLIFLIIAFLFIRKISNTGELKVKIEPVADSFEIKDMDDPELQNQQAFDFEAQQETTFQELVVLNLISVDK
jgi:hypothetical protein